jgi:hypothetical protein
VRSWYALVDDQMLDDLRRAVQDLRMAGWTDPDKLVYVANALAGAGDRVEAVDREEPSVEDLI